MEALQEEVGRLEFSLAKANKEMVEKVEQVKKLSKKVAELKDGNGLEEEAHPNADEHLRNERVINQFENLPSILPEEVWLMIFNELSDGKDLASLLNTCHLFRRVLLKRSPTFLFPQTFPALCKHLEGVEILQCRVVCKAWNSGVDRFLEDHKSIRPHDDENYDPREPSFLTPMEEKRLHTPSSVALNIIDRYSDRLGQQDGIISPDRNPFIGRAVVINNWSFGATENVLELYREHIWYLTISTDSRWECTSGCNCFGTFEHVFLVLQNLPPNLRKLRIINAKDEPFFEPPYSRRYPRLANLETLHFDTSPRALHRKLSSRYHPQLRRVHMRAVHWLSVYNLGWPALVELHLQDLSTNDAHYDSLLEAEMPNLRKLGCGSKKDDCDSKDMFDRILDIITNLSKITRLNIVRFNEHISMGWSQHSTEQVRPLAPPSLKTMEIEHFCNPGNDLTDYSILLHFPFLENINVYWGEVEGSKGSNSSFPESSHSEHGHLSAERQEGRISDSELVKVNRYINRKELYKSNIWELLPRLKVLTFRLDLYTREGYDNFMKRKEGSIVL